ncbi:MAG: fibronectin type III domain-containing protein, partial [Oscillospiraceae bacterium]|nr:fibronectin type III domain-containing protein [Oscillospiraceae bacterium]
GSDLYLKEKDVTVTYKGEKLEEGLDYYVRTFNDDKIGLATAMIVPTEMSDFVGVKFAQFAVVPQAVANVKYTDHTSTSVTIQFNTTKGAERYAVFTADSIGAQVADVAAKKGAKTQSVTIKDLTPNKTYKLIVKPYFEEDGEVWCGPDSNVITTKTDTKALATPASVKNVKLVKATKTSAQISFSKSSGADGYAIFGFTSGKKYATVSTQKGASTLKKTISGLKAGKTYKFTVRPYKKIDGKVYYGDTSKTVVVKITK